MFIQNPIQIYFFSSENGLSSYWFVKLLSIKMMTFNPWKFFCAWYVLFSFSTITVIQFVWDIFLFSWQIDKASFRSSYQKSNDLDSKWSNMVFQPTVEPWAPMLKELKKRRRRSHLHLWDLSWFSTEISQNFYNDIVI